MHHNGTQNNDTNSTLSIMAFRIKAIGIECCNAECQIADGHYSGYHFTECRNHYIEIEL